MVDFTTTLLAFEDATARRAWIAEHYPAPDQPLVQHLHKEALRREKDDPHQTLALADVVADLAAHWDDELTRVTATLIRANALRLLADPESGSGALSRGHQHLPRAGHDVRSSCRHHRPD